MAPAAFVGSIVPRGSDWEKTRAADDDLQAPLRTTFAALSPFGPCWHSNSTASPSLSVLYPESWIAEKWTNTSSPLDR
jgi:hypothetical protein